MEKVNLAATLQVAMYSLENPVDFEARNVTRSSGKHAKGRHISKESG